MGMDDQFNKVARSETFIGALPIDTSNWLHVFSACLGKMMAIQNACGEIVVRGQNWNVDFSEGVIYFGSSQYPLQFIGSESASSHTWLWGWKNVNNFSEKIICMAQHTKEMGEQWHLEPLTTAEFGLNHTFNGHSLSIVACGLLNRCCYYRGPHAGGAIFVAFSNVPQDVFSAIDAAKFSSLTMQCIQQYPIDHKIFVESLLLWNGTPYEWNNLTVTAHFQQDLHIEFEQADAFLRIRSMKSK